MVKRKKPFFLFCLWFEKQLLFQEEKQHHGSSVQDIHLFFSGHGVIVENEKTHI